jgi:hypothetical protein
MVDLFSAPSPKFVLLGRNAMFRHISASRWLFLSLTAALAVIFQPPQACRAAALGIIVPSYFYPGTGGPGGVGDGWAAMGMAAGQVSLTAILNPDSGPLPGPADPNYTNAMTNLENADGKVVAYVYTDNGSTSLSSVESQMSTYVSQYGSLIDGFFVDGMNVVPSTLSYYQSIDSYVKGLNSSYTVIGNPGQPYLNGVSPANYLSTADVFNIFENPPTGSSGFGNYPFGQTWYQSYPANRFSNIVYDLPSGSLSSEITRAAQLNVGNVYMTDQTTPNPYAQLPSYWDQEVSAVADASTPEPGTLASSLVLISSMIMHRPKSRRPKGAALRPRIVPAFSDPHQ